MMLFEEIFLDGGSKSVIQKGASPLSQFMQ